MELWVRWKETLIEVFFLLWGLAHAQTALAFASTEYSCSKKLEKKDICVSFVQTRDINRNESGIQTHFEFGFSWRFLFSDKFEDV
jgi:hypothetical protein